MTNYEYLNKRMIDPQEVGGGNRLITHKELDVWRAFAGGGHVSEGDRDILMNMIADFRRECPVGPKGDQGNVNIYNTNNQAPQSRSGRFLEVDLDAVGVFFLYVAAGCLVSIIIYAVYLFTVGFVADLLGFIKDHSPWSYLLVFIPSIAGTILFAYFNSPRNDHDSLI